MIGEFEPPTRNLSGTLPDASDDSLPSYFSPTCTAQSIERYTPDEDVCVQSYANLQTIPLYQLDLTIQ